MIERLQTLVSSDGRFKNTRDGGWEGVRNNYINLNLQTFIHFVADKADDRAPSDPCVVRRQI